MLGLLAIAVPVPRCSVTGLTLSNEQHAGLKRVVDAGLAEIEIVIRDYRDVTDVYDAVISVEMLEVAGRHLPRFRPRRSRGGWRASR